MPLTQGNLTANLSFALQAQSLLIAPSQSPNGLVTFNLNNLNLGIWNAVYIGQFTVYNTAAPTSLTATLATGGTLTASTEYFYVVTAVGPNGALSPNGPAATTESVASNEAHATTTMTQKTINLAWTAVTGATSYNVYRGTVTGTENLLIGNTTDTSFSDTGIAGSSQSPPGSAASYVEFSILSFTDLAGNSVTLTNVLSLEVVTAGDAGATCELAPGSSNGLTWYMNNGGIILDVPGVEAHSAGVASSGYTVDGTHETLRLTNSGSGTLSALVAIIGSTVGG